MYKDFFRLKENPFNVNPDPRYLFLTQHTEEALACLTYGIENRKGFILLTGEVGTGKTTLLNKLLERLQGEQVATVFIFNSRLNVTQFLDFVMANFRIPWESKSTQTMKSQVLLRLNQWLLERHRAGKTAVLIVDEAQHLSPSVLEEIRLLTNLETPTEKLLQIVLSGQPELEQNLSQPQLRQLHQRITLRCRTHPLTLEETYGYLSERLRIAGLSASATGGADGQSSARTEWKEIFAPDAIEAVHSYSQGIPRVINLLCEHALISAYAQQQEPIPAETVAEVARDFQLHEIRPTPPPSPTSGDGENRHLIEVLQNLGRLIGHAHPDRTE
jgi:type II secretory pathway predicted ATPase ExeA